MKSMSQWRDTFANAVRVLRDEVPVDQGETPHQVVMTENKARLYRYDQPEPRHATPVLLVPSMINRHTLLDLSAENSIVRNLLKAGYRVYVLDWGRPSDEDRFRTVEDYLDGLMHRFVRKAALDAGAPTITLGGYCMGGTLALLYAALHPEKIRNLILLATPVDFSHGGKLRKWASRDSFDVQAFVDGVGNAPPSILQPAYGMLIPTWRARHWTTFFQMGHDPAFVKQFVAISKWTEDNVDLPADVFRLFARDLYQENRLVEGGLRIGGREVRLSSIRAPIFNAASARDHIVTPACAFKLKELVGSDEVEQVAFKSGHIGLSMGPQAHAVVWPTITRWLEARS